MVGIKGIAVGNRSKVDKLFDNIDELLRLTLKEIMTEDQIRDMDSNDLLTYQTLLLTLDSTRAMYQDMADTLDWQSLILSNINTKLDGIVDKVNKAE